jgi:hypothetical protein
LNQRSVLAFGYGATDIFNIKIGPEKEWDTESQDQESCTENPASEEANSPFVNEDPEYGQPINYPMYLTPYSPSFEAQDPYQAQTSFQMLGSPYTDSPVYAGTPCGQINLSPQQAMFPFNTYPLDSTPDQSAAMSPQDYTASPSTFYAGNMEQSASTLSAANSFALQTSPPEVSDIPANYSGFEAYHMDYQSIQNESHNSGYSNAIAQESFQSYDSASNMYSHPYHTPHHSVDHQAGDGMFMHSQYPVNDQSTLEGSVH